MFWFLLIALVVVVAAVTLAVASGDDTTGVLPEPAQDRMAWPLPAGRPVGRADVEALRLPMVLRGYRMAETDDVLDRLGAELAERDARIAELEAALAGAQAAAMGGRGLIAPQDAPPAAGEAGSGPAEDTEGGTGPVGRPGDEKTDGAGGGKRDEEGTA
ncbi:DivIVA domain-containing protein [Streptomyces sp. SCA3-4]|uniref:DivIVA domain-containing protein n=1 Tax=Streptomyces sichuanensis TaxID=2871810 RepID=UPI001CE32EF9|nr:DivIVA domain-containing protein [Streptomyces sichuanensis]MCA6096250.1 DivIVA domain-containing protein [Streptomyces sichuanensis]